MFTTKCPSWEQIFLHNRHCGNRHFGTEDIMHLQNIQHLEMLSCDFSIQEIHMCLFMAIFAFTLPHNLAVLLSTLRYNVPILRYLVHLVIPYGVYCDQTGEITLKHISPITFINCKIFRSADRHLPVGQYTMSRPTIGRRI